MGTEGVEAGVDVMVERGESRQSVNVERSYQCAEELIRFVGATEESSDFRHEPLHGTVC